jgi:hypothetical protein
MEAATAIPRSLAPGRGTSVTGEVLAVLRLAFTMRLDAASVVGRDATIALLGAVALAVWVVLGYTDINGAAQLETSGFAELAAVAAVVLALAWLTARVARPPLPIRQTLWLICGYLPAATAAGWLFTQHLSRTLFLVIATFAIAHAAAYFWFGLRGTLWWHAMAAIRRIAAGRRRLHRAASSHPARFPRLVVALAPDQVADYQESVRRAEELMYLQPGRIDAALDSIATDEGEGTRLYFVGFAGFGPQKVFSEEIQLAARRVHERYGTAGRRVLLVNDRRDFDSHPLATRSALARTLTGIGKRMDRERDVLFLALSSHGKKDPHLVVENGALQLDQLTVKSLANMLRESGIRWKVLVISACYAGAFIEPLRDPIHGDHHRRQARPHVLRLQRPPRAHLLRRGLLPRRLAGRGEPARGLRHRGRDIAQRERAQGLKPSEPQAWFGADIERKLAELEAARLHRDLGPEPAEGAGEYQRIDQPVEHELDRGAPLARVPD